MIDPALSEKGKADARELGLNPSLQQLAPKALVVCSPMTRCIQTAALGLPGCRIVLHPDTRDHE